MRFWRSKAYTDFFAFLDATPGFFEEVSPGFPSSGGCSHPEPQA